MLGSANQISRSPQRAGGSDRRGASRSASIGWIAEGERPLVGGFFLLTALGYNTFVTLRRPDLYAVIAERAPPPYAWLLRDVIRLLGMPFTLLLIDFKLGVGLLVLGRGVAVKPGLWAAIGFELALIPGLGMYGPVNLPLATGQALLLRRDFDRSALAVLRGRRVPGASRGRLAAR